MKIVQCDKCARLSTDLSLEFHERTAPRVEAYVYVAPYDLCSICAPVFDNKITLVEEKNLASLQTAITEFINIDIVPTVPEA